MLDGGRKEPDARLPVQDSKFKESGMLTPEEFVRAGDYLVYHCPTWSWAIGEAGRKKAYLPVDKQFLVTKNGRTYCIHVCKMRRKEGRVCSAMLPEVPPDGRAAHE